MKPLAIMIGVAVVAAALVANLLELRGIRARLDRIETAQTKGN